MSSIFFRYMLYSDIPYIRISKKSFEKAIGGMPDVNIRFWSRSYIFFEKKNRDQKINFQTFFRTLKSKNSVFWGFSENHDFRPKTILLNSNIGWKFNFFDEINFQTFFILLKPTERVFYIPDIFFQSKVKIRNVHSIFLFSRFLPTLP